MKTVSQGTTATDSQRLKSVNPCDTDTHILIYMTSNTLCQRDTGWPAGTWLQRCSSGWHGASGSSPETPPDDSVSCRLDLVEADMSQNLCSESDIQSVDILKYKWSLRQGAAQDFNWSSKERCLRKGWWHNSVFIYSSPLSMFDSYCYRK